MANHTAFMKLWVGDYLSDTGALNTQRHGAYFLLILEYWKSGCLPKSDEELFLVCKALASNAQDDVLFVRDKFFPDGIHKRLDKELSLAKKSYDKRVSAQAKSVESRKVNSNAVAKQVAMPLQSSDSDSDSNNLLSKDELLNHFEYLWVKWGKGARKSDAKKWFLSKGKKRDSEFYLMLNEKVSDYFKWRITADNAGIFVPHLPAFVVWLNGERWEDELGVIEPRQQNKPSPWNILISKLGVVDRDKFPEFDDPLISEALFKCGSWMELSRMTDKQALFQFKPKFEEVYKSLGGAT